MAGELGGRWPLLTGERAHYELGRQNVHQTATDDTTLGTHVADLATESIAAGERLELTFFWQEAQRWEGTNFVVAIG